MQYEVIPVGLYEANCVLITDDEGRTLIVDPGADAPELIDIIERAGLKPSAICLTHGHFDHISGVGGLVAKYSIPVYLSANDREMAFSPFNTMQPGYEGIAELEAYDYSIKEGEPLPAWPKGVIMETPGHSKGSTCLYIEDEKLLVAGDTLFMSSIGRTDLPGGSYSEILVSLKRLASLPEDTTVICGHGPSTTIGREKRCNQWM